MYDFPIISIQMENFMVMKIFNENGKMSFGKGISFGIINHIFSFELFQHENYHISREIKGCTNWPKFSFVTECKVQQVWRVSFVELKLKVLRLKSKTDRPKTYSWHLILQAWTSTSTTQKALKKMNCDQEKLLKIHVLINNFFFYIHSLNFII